jgi:2-polyprenyl-6-methoxyphenol hydroxylase-like FAD-dependent oxidoreductase
MPPFKILIIGSGAAGVASAIAISKAFPTAELTIFELRNEHGTIGGAVNLTPNALRCLDVLGVLEQLKIRRSGCVVNSIQLFSLHTAASMGTIDFRGSKYLAMRVMRSELLQAMLDVATKLDIQIKYGKKLTGIEDTPEFVKVMFEDGSENGHLVLGCDGIHSATRVQIDPDRTPEYSGISSAYGFTKSEEKMFFEETGLAMSRSGAILTTYCDAQRERIYIAALTESKLELSKEGWRALGKDQEVVRQNILERFEDSALPNMKELVHSVDDWFLYPVYLLPPVGKWCTERVMLLGDAAHAVSQYLPCFQQR